MPRLLGFDTETTSPTRLGKFIVHEAEIIGYSLATEAGRAAYVEGVPGPDMQDILESGEWVKVFHNAKFDLGRLNRLGIKVYPFEDTKIAAYLLGYLSTGLKSLTRQLLSTDPITYSQVTGGRDMSELEPAEIVQYASGDADNTLRLWLILQPQLEREGLTWLYEDVEKPLVYVLIGMEERGVLVNEEATLTLHSDILARKEEYRQATLTILGPINLASHEQLAWALEKLGCPISSRTATKNQLVTDESALNGVREWNPPLIDSLLGFKEMAKLEGYTRSFLELRSADGRLHPQFNQAGHYERAEMARDAPGTGRLSCSVPNLQQVPHHGNPVWAKRVRQCIVARPGCVLVSGDIGQEEPRITGLVAPEPALTALFDQGVAPYSVFGELLYGRPITKRDEVEWFTAKTYFLARLYGCGWQKIHEIDARIDLNRARQAHVEVGRMFPGLASYAERVEEEVMRQGWLRDWFGRRRMFPGVWSASPLDRQAAVRAAANFLISGPAATVIKLAMQRVAAQTSGLVLSIHDELVLEVEECQVNQSIQTLGTMTLGLMPIVLPVAIQMGKDWGNMSSI
jgi:DNA polymerase-1